MTVAAKHFDPQLGVDIHLYEIPPDPVPVPLPTPHIGIVFDPFDYLPILGGTVQVNGIKRANAGTAGLDTHIPIGGIWMPEMDMAEGPQQQDQLFMGSKTVLADGSPFSKLCMPVLDCNMIGMIPPLRPRKPEQKSMSLTLPTAVNLAIPTNVFVGGPPTVSLTALAFDAAFAGLKALRKTERFAQAMEKFRNLRKRLFSHLPDDFLKCKILRAEPVDIRDGSVVVEHEDFAVPGRLSLIWIRKYRSGRDRDGLCGHGWRTPADICLELHPDGSALFIDVHGATLFPTLPVADGYEHAVVELVDGAKLYQHGESWLIQAKDGLRHVFRRSSDNVIPLQQQSLPIERVEDLCGNHWRFERSNGQLIRIQENGIDNLRGRFIEVTSHQGRIRQLHLHDPATGLNHSLAIYDHDSNDDLLAVIDPLGAKLCFEYQQHQLVRHTDRNGLSFYYEYNARLQVIHAWGDGGLYDYRFRYDSLLRETVVTDSLGHVSIVKFDEYGLPLCEIDPLDGVTVFEYDDAGRTVGVTDPAGLRTGFDYDDHGNLLRLAQPDGNALLMAYDKDDRPISITAPGGALWRQQWDARGLLREQHSPLGAITRFAYDEHGQPVEHINALGAKTRLSFDRHGALAELVDALGYIRRFDYDSLGNLCTQIDSDGQSTRYRYDDKGRLLEVIAPRGIIMRCEYDAENRLVRHIDGSGAETRVEYSGTGMVARRLQPDGRSVRYSYDTEEQLTGVVNQRGETYRLVRDPLGRIIEEIDYWGQGNRYDYDAGGRLQRTTDPLGHSIVFSTDALGRITCKTMPDPKDPSRQTRETFRYDNAGHLVEMRNACAYVVRRFDAEGRLLQEVQNGFTVDHAYDSLGNRIERRSSAGNSVRINYDLLSRPERIAINDAAPIALERNALGQVITEQLSPSLCRTMSYNAAGLLSAEAVTNENMPLFGNVYTYDKAGNLAQRTDSEYGSDRYAYDPMGRVLEHTDPAGKITRWLNDPAGDRLQTSALEVRMQQAVGGDPLADTWTRVGSYGGLHYVFDRVGNLIRREHIQLPDRPSLHLVWDANQRLTESRWQGGERHDQRVTYGYDPLGRRIFKRNPSHTTWFFWDGDTLLAEVTQPNNDSVSLREPLTQNNVIDFVAARKRLDALKNLHIRAREYVYQPGTFEPLAAIEKTQAEIRPKVSTTKSALSTQTVPAVHPVAAGSNPPLPAPVRPPALARIVPQATTRTSTVRSPEAKHGLGMGLRLGDKSLSNTNVSADIEPAAPASNPASAGTPTSPTMAFGMVLGGASISGKTTDKASKKPTDTRAGPTTSATKPAPVQISPPASAALTSTVSLAVDSEDSAQVEPAEAGDAVSHILFFHNAANGCPLRLTDDKGAVQWSASYDAWGAVREYHVTLIANPLRLQGQYQDPETGLHYNRFRYYEPGVGSFISQDPIRLAGGIGIYQFAANTSAWIDPLGLACGPTVRRNSRGQWIDARGRFAKAPFINGHTEASILAVPKFSRILPQSYLPTNYISQHLGQFRGTVSKIMKEIPPYAELGPPTGHFVMPQSVADDLINQSSSVADLERRLALRPGDLGTNPLRVDIPSPTGLRVPSGNEFGAWDGLWRPGGYTGGGIPEATIDPTPLSGIVTNPIFPKPTP